MTVAVPGTRRIPRPSNGTLAVLAFVLVLVVGWLAYRNTIPPRWLHDFGEEIAIHAAPDPNAPPPEDSRQATPRGLSSSPYICAARAIHIPWDRIEFIASKEDARGVEALVAAKWPANKTLDAFADEVRHDPRYQGIVLLKDNRVVAAELFFTFWADLSALARPSGFTPADAVFTARVANGTYVLSVPKDVPADGCN
jgi:hypothetical protein